MKDNNKICLTILHLSPSTEELQDSVFRAHRE